MPAKRSESKTLRKMKQVADDLIIDVLKNGRMVLGADGNPVRVTATAADIGNALRRLANAGEAAMDEHRMTEMEWFSRMRQLQREEAKPKNDAEEPRPTPYVDPMKFKTA